MSMPVVVEPLFTVMAVAGSNDVDDARTSRILGSDVWPPVWTLTVPLIAVGGMTTVIEFAVAVVAAACTVPEAAANVTLLAAGVVLKPEPFKVSVSPRAARPGKMDDNVRGADAGGGVKPVAVPAATLASTRRFLKKKSSMP